jgi:mannitol/fructose-specific phosphotransferase system IIA component (Ntr-type)
VVIWDQPVSRDNALRRLVDSLNKDSLGSALEGLFDKILEREEQGSTFLNEGVAFPHVRIEGLADPLVALGLTKKGISDISTEKPIEAVFLIVSPAQKPDIQVKLLGQASRAMQSRHLLQEMRKAGTAQEVMMSILAWEIPQEADRVV